MNMLPRVALVSMLLLLGAVGAHAAGCDAPSPHIRPGTTMADLPEAAANFAGTWQGQWPIAVKDHIVPICARLYISVNGPQTATIEQCTGSARTARRKAECRQFAGEINGNFMTFSDLQGTVYSLTIADVGGMKAEATSAQHRSVTVFQKQ